MHSPGNSQQICCKAAMLLSLVEIRCYLRQSDYETLKPTYDSISAGRLVILAIKGFTCVVGIGLGSRLLDYLP